MVSVLAFYSDDLSSNPAICFSVKLFEEYENEQKEAVMAHLKKEISKMRKIRLERK